MSDQVTDELRRLILQNQEMEIRLQQLQLSVYGMRADFEQVVAARLRELATPSEPMPCESMPAAMR